MAVAVKEEAILEALRGVQDPDLHRDIVSLGFVKNLKVCGGMVSFDIELTTPACPVKDRLREEAQRRVRALSGVEEVTVNMTSSVRGRVPSPQELLPGVKHMIAIASGKGGVGKSTVAANLAVALGRTGATVGLMDADVYGPSIPTLLGLAGARPDRDAEGRLLPIPVGPVRVMSMGLISTPGTPVIWRGPMATKLIQQFLGGVDWGPLDYLILDLPPGTGDVQLTIVQSAPLTGAVIVTTPQDLALEVAWKGLRMFEQVNVPVLGVVENMSYFLCPHCGERTEIFRHGGARRACEEKGVPFLGEVPIAPEIVLAGDEGIPLVLRDPDAPAARAYIEIASRMAAQASIAAIEGGRGAPGLAGATVLDDGHLALRWQDGHEGRYEMAELRYLCPCALCVDEGTGERRIRRGDVHRGVRAEEIRPVGRYGITIRWSDGHATGIYPFRYLRDHCQCEECRARQAALPMPSS